MVTALRAPLFVPADRPERFAKAAAAGADAIILDLEDAVAPAAKQAARDALCLGFTDLPVLVRINAAGTPWHAADLAAVTALRPAGVILPKAECAQTVTRLAEASACPVFALIECAHGLAQARAIALAPGVAQLVFGSLDYCADIGCAHSRDVLLPVRSELVLAARLAGLSAPLDGVTAALHDLALTHDDARHARALGMAGKLCIHPKQVAAVLRAFNPTAEEIAWARRILTSGDGAVSVDGAMVDAPVRLRAEAILTQAAPHPSLSAS